MTRSLYCVSTLVFLFLFTPLYGQSTTAPSTSPAQIQITVRALIDGRSQLILKGKTAQWRHFDYAAPGMFSGRNEPTTINGIRWFPQWEDSDLDHEVRISKALSDSFDKLDPPLPAAPMTVTLQKLHCRGQATIVQQPTPENDFTTIVEFNDDDIRGADWYELRLTLAQKS